MAELALGIAGVVPLVSCAIKVYKEVNSKLKLFCHGSKEVKRIRKVFGVQSQVFANECRLWLAFVEEDDDVASEMASDPEHSSWDDPRLNAFLRCRLGDNYDAWFQIKQKSLKLSISLRKASKDSRNQAT